MKNSIKSRKVINSLGLGIMATLSAASAAPAVAFADEADDKGSSVADSSVNAASTDTPTADSLTAAAAAAETAKYGVSEDIQANLDNVAEAAGSLADDALAFDKANADAQQKVDEYNNAVAQDALNQSNVANINDAKNATDDLASKAELGSAQAALDSNRDAAEKLYETQEAADAARAEAQDRASEAEKLLEAAQASMAAAESKVRAAQDALASLERQQESAEAALDSSKLAVEAAQDALNILLANGDSQVAITNAQAALTAAQSEFNDAVIAKNQADAAVAEKQAEIDNAGGNLDDALAKVQAAQTALDAANEKLAAADELYEGTRAIYEEALNRRNEKDQEAQVTYGVSLDGLKDAIVEAQRERDSRQDFANIPDSYEKAVTEALDILGRAQEAKAEADGELQTAREEVARLEKDIKDIEGLGSFVFKEVKASIDALKVAVDMSAPGTGVGDGMDSGMMATDDSVIKNAIDENVKMNIVEVANNYYADYLSSNDLGPFTWDSDSQIDVFFDPLNDNKLEISVTLKLDKSLDKSSFSVRLNVDGSDIVYDFNDYNVFIGANDTISPYVSQEDYETRSLEALDNEAKERLNELNAQYEETEIKQSAYDLTENAYLNYFDNWVRAKQDYDDAIKERDLYWEFDSRVTDLQNLSNEYEGIKVELSSYEYHPWFESYKEFADAQTALDEANERLAQAVGGQGNLAELQEQLATLTQEAGFVQSRYKAASNAKDNVEASLTAITNAIENLGSLQVVQQANEELLAQLRAQVEGAASICQDAVSSYDLSGQAIVQLQSLVQQALAYANAGAFTVDPSVTPDVPVVPDTPVIPDVPGISEVVTIPGTETIGDTAAMSALVADILGTGGVATPATTVIADDAVPMAAAATADEAARTASATVADATIADDANPLASASEGMRSQGVSPLAAAGIGAASAAAVIGLFALARYFFFASKIK